MPVTVPDFLREHFEQGYHPMDEPPGLEEAAYKQWVKEGGKPIAHRTLSCEVRLLNGDWATWAEIKLEPGQRLGDVPFGQLKPDTRTRWI